MEKFNEKPTIFHVILAIVAGVFSFFLFTRTANPAYLIPLGAIFLAGINSALNGLWLGLGTSLLGSIGGIWYHLNKLGPVLSPSDDAAKIAKKTATFLERQAVVADYKIWIILGIVAFSILARYAYIKLREQKEEEPALAQKKSTYSTKTLVYAAVFVALSVAINSLRIGNISFGGFPIIFGGFALGPIMGFIIGSVADILGFLIRPSSTGGFNPLFILTSGLTGLIPVFVLRFIPVKDRFSNFVAILISIAIGQIITSVIMVPIFRYWLYAHPLLVTMGNAAIKQLYSVPLYALLFINTQKVILREVNFNIRKMKKTKSQTI
ncbi:MAG: folate family ECF transporter S component [Tissierellia bacterium]|nr:folate family ECF transporter S component [Tissierellia bacterium]